jgi:cytochrome c-type biogenesis protein CcmH
MKLGRLLAVVGGLCCLALTADDPSDRLANPAQEAHARALFREIRCIVCQSESIDESDAELAHDLRQLVRQDVAAGESDAAIKAGLVHRYGEFILLQPRFSLANAALWLAPFAVVLAGLGVLLSLRRAAKPPAEVLSDAEAARLKTLMRE